MRLFPIAVLLAATAPAACSSSASAQDPAEFSVRGASARCARPIDPQYLKDARIAFRGTVTTVTEELVSVQVDRTFAGEVTRSVRLRTGEAHSETLSGSGAFTEGRTYLITVGNGGVADCLSGPADDAGLRKSYEDAFGN